MEASGTQMVMRRKKTDITSKDNDAILQLEGELKIQGAPIFLKVNPFKICLLIIPVALSMVGLLLLKYYKWFRVMVFYSQVPQYEADYIYIEGTDGIEAISAIETKYQKSVKLETRSFFFEGLKYQIVEGRAFPIGFRIFSQFASLAQSGHFIKGIDKNILSQQLQVYGKNQHKVKSPMYFEYIFDVMTKPFFIMQYVICVVMILQKYELFAGLMVGASLLTTSINYVLLYFNFRKIKQIAQKVILVEVLRQGKYAFVDSCQLVPGDIFKPNEQIMCDAVLIKGQIYLNQSSLTGESVPIGKFPAKQQSHLVQKNRWLYQGSKVMQARPNTLALVVNTGYRTNRGRTIRKIMNRHAKQPDFFITAIYFFIECWIVATIIFAATIPIVLDIDITTEFIIYKYLDFVGWSFPPIFPILFNLAYSFSLARLASNNIYGNQPQKTVQSAKMKIMCFDKTGTLTENQLEVHQVIKFHQGVKQNITLDKKDPKNSLIMKLFASCHTVREIEGQYVGDQVDLRMFIFSEFKMKKWNVQDDFNVKFVVQNTNQKQQMKLQILRINQFESKLQSMSVLVRDVIEKQTYCFLKGAPEKIQGCGINKITDYERTVSDLCLGGYRTIGFSYRKIHQQDVNKFLNGPRQMFQEHMTTLGLIAFENKLKEDTVQTIEYLHEANIQAKMITGDNIYIAVQTGMRAKIIDPQEKVILLEGRKQQSNQDSQGNRNFIGTLLYQKDYQIHQQPIVLTQKNYMNSQYSLVVDNDFLKLQPPPQISKSIKVFARISSENKAFIIRKFKQKISEERNKLSRIKKFFGDTKHKVGMAGDGANDLMAIRQADVGLGINDSDASYAASFTIAKLTDVCQVVREGKNSQQNIIQIVRYYGSLSFVRVIFSVLLIQDATFFSSTQAIYSFVGNVFFPIALALSRPSKKMNPYSPCSNFMGIQNHLVYWGNIFWVSSVAVGGLLYYKTTEQYEQNPKPVVGQDGYFSLCHSTTIVWLIIEVPFIVTAFFIYSSNPFKQKFFTNYMFLVGFIIFTLLGIGVFFLTPQLGDFFNLVTVSNEEAAIVLGITLGGMFLCWIYNLLIQSFAFHQKNTNEDPLNTKENQLSATGQPNRSNQPHRVTTLSAPSVPSSRTQRQT